MLNCLRLGVNCLELVGGCLELVVVPGIGGGSWNWWWFLELVVVPWNQRGSSLINVLTMNIISIVGMFPSVIEKNCKFPW